MREKFIRVFPGLRMGGTCGVLSHTQRFFCFDSGALVTCDGQSRFVITQLHADLVFADKPSFICAVMLLSAHALSSGGANKLIPPSVGDVFSILRSVAAANSSTSSSSAPAALFARDTSSIFLRLDGAHSSASLLRAQRRRAKPDGDEWVGDGGGAGWGEEGWW